MPMSSYYERMKAARATHGMMAFCNRDTAMKIAREADAEIEGLRKLLREALEDWYYDMPNPSDEAIQTAEAVQKAIAAKGVGDE